MCVCVCVCVCGENEWWFHFVSKSQFKGSFITQQLPVGTWETPVAMEVDKLRAEGGQADGGVEDMKEEETKKGEERQKETMDGWMDGWMGREEV